MFEDLRIIASVRDVIGLKLDMGYRVTDPDPKQSAAIARLAETSPHLLDDAGFPGHHPDRAEKSLLPHPFRV